MEIIKKKTFVNDLSEMNAVGRLFPELFLSELEEKIKLTATKKGEVLEISGEVVVMNVDEYSALNDAAEKNIEKDGWLIKELERSVAEASSFDENEKVISLFDLESVMDQVNFQKNVDRWINSMKEKGDLK